MQGFSPTSNKAGRRSRLLTVHMFDAAGIQLINVRTAGLGDASDGSALVFDPSQFSRPGRAHQPVTRERIRSS
jgi:hypothetical protein